ncbi:DUF427 domain-containing protein [Tenacibaculum maritimum]|uniref:DUF427 domain-containing protein n=1 Tax=Tenacibaculum maritimum TaxID=107401 RepID=UPI001F250DB9|nr:DUF427 domain-containing protein [Tenacibaculum maritimum]
MIAESETTEIVEGNHYFPPESIHKVFFKHSKTQSTCPWKGQASYYTLLVNGQENKDAAWYYKHPSNKVKHIKNYIAFWKGVSIKK